MRLIDADKFKKLLINQRSVAIDQYLYVLDGVLEDLEDEPTIDPVKHGHWIDVELIRSFGTLNGIQCSECGKQQVKGSFGVPKYCSECGSKMDSEVTK